MALDLDHTRSLTPPAPPTPVSRARPAEAPSGPPLRVPGPPESDVQRPGPPMPIAAPPTVVPDAPERRRLVTVIGVLAIVTLAGAGVVLAFVGDDDDDRPPSTDSTSTAAAGTFAVDLSTGDGHLTQSTMFVASPTLPLPSIGLPMPGVTLPPGATTPSVDAAPTTIG